MDDTFKWRRGRWGWARKSCRPQHVLTTTREVSGHDEYVPWTHWFAGLYHMQYKVDLQEG